MTRESKIILVVDIDEARRFDLIVQLSLAGFAGVGVTDYAQARREFDADRVSALVLYIEGSTSRDADAFATEVRSVTTAPLVLIGDGPEVRDAALHLIASVLPQNTTVSDVIEAVKTALRG